MVFPRKRPVMPKSATWSYHTPLIHPIGTHVYPDSKVHGANMGYTWGWQDPGGPLVGHMSLAIWVTTVGSLKIRTLTYVMLNSKTNAYKCDLVDIIPSRCITKEFAGYMPCKTFFCQNQHILVEEHLNTHPLNVLEVSMILHKQRKW